MHSTKSVAVCFQSCFKAWDAWGVVYLMEKSPKVIKLNKMNFLCGYCQQFSHNVNSILNIMKSFDRKEFLFSFTMKVSYASWGYSLRNCGYTCFPWGVCPILFVARLCILQQNWCDLFIVPRAESLERQDDTQGVCAALISKGRL